MEKPKIPIHFIEIKLKYAEEELADIKSKLAEAEEEVKYWQTQKECTLALNQGTIVPTEEII